MKVAILSDVNANLEALTAVLSDIQAQDIKDIIFLGDAVGYGPNPLECLALLRERAKIYLLGWWESYLFKDQHKDLSPRHQVGLAWANEIIKASPDNWNWLNKRLSVYNEDGITGVHHDLRGLEAKTLMLENVLASPSTTALEIFPLFSRLLFMGDNHCPWVLTEKLQGHHAKNIDNTFCLPSSYKTIVSVGSVGQPRDKDPRACYVIATNEKILWRRVEYDFKQTIAKIEKIPELENMFGERLIMGI